MSIPNIITMMRIVLIPLFMVCMSQGWDIAALTLFIGVGLTDALDGYLARKMNQVTDIGKLLDPLADKLLVTAAVLYFMADGRMAVWMVMVIITREFVISTLRVVAASKGTVMAAGWSGKIKTTVQMTGIIYLLSPFCGAAFFSTGITWDTLTVWMITLVTIWSGVDYLWKHRKLFVTK